MQPVPRTILFVCTGNICRSPLAEGVFRHVADTLGHGGMRFDSAGLGSWHLGEAPDRRSIVAAQGHGIDISCQVCRIVRNEDFFRFDLIAGMDSGHVEQLDRLRPAGATAQVALFSAVFAGRRADVPDPYTGTQADFEAVYGMIRAAADTWFGAVGRASSGQDSSIT
jgi:protein-tyrosine phosphatase